MTLSPDRNAVPAQSWWQSVLQSTLKEAGKLEERIGQLVGKETEES